MTQHWQCMLKNCALRECVSIWSEVSMWDNLGVTDHSKAWCFMAQTSKDTLYMSLKRSLTPWEMNRLAQKAKANWSLHRLSVRSKENEFILVLRHFKHMLDDSYKLQIMDKLLIMLVFRCARLENYISVIYLQLPALWYSGIRHPSVCGFLLCCV